MTNEAALLCIAAIWLLSGRGANLCLIIMAYYAAYLVSTNLSPMVVYDQSASSTSIYYLTQSAIDSTVVVSCVAISMFYKRFIIIYGAYAAIVVTSLFCELLMLLDQSFGVGVIFKLHALRQQASIPLDILFAVIGSAAGERLLTCFFLRIGGWSGYNCRNGD